MGSPLDRLVAACARRPGLVVLLAVALAWLGGRAALRAPLDALPDLSDAQVIVFTDWEGRSPDLVEAQVTTVLTRAMLAAPRVQAVRGQSMFGMSFVYVVFEDGTDLDDARARVLEQLSTLAARLPPDAMPTLAPDATGVGWVYQYVLVDPTGRKSLPELRALQDWSLRYLLESVEGVAQVASIGGFVRQVQVQVDPDRLVGLGVPLSEVVTALRRHNADVGGRSLDLGGHEYMVRGRGYLRSPADIAALPLGGPLPADEAMGGAMSRSPASRRVTPLRVGDVAVVDEGPEPRRGVADFDGRGEAVGGIVIMRQGENALRVIDRVKAALEAARPGLDGVEVVPVYDRSTLIVEAVGTLRRTLIEEAVVVSLIILAFLGSFRSVLIPIVVLPVAVLASFLPIEAQGLSLNLMSLGGIAVAVGAMVDGAIIVVENVHRHLEAWQEDPKGSRAEVVVRAMQEVAGSVFFSLLLLTVSFLPVFTLQATEGRLFAPLAWTKTWAMGFAALAAVTLTPALVVLLVRGRVAREEANPLNRWLIRAYAPVVRAVVRGRWVVIPAAALSVVATVPVLLQLPGEFMPPLHEGSLLYMPTAPPGISESEAMRVLQAMDREIRAVPEVASVFGKMGRADTPTDPAPLSMAETVIQLKPRSEWRPGLTWEGLIAELDARVQWPGFPNAWWMPIQTRTEMLSTGIRSPLGVKVYGDDPAAVEAAAVAVEGLARGIAGTRSAVAERTGGGLYLDVEVDRERAARYGLGPADVNEVVATGIGGLPVTWMVEGRARTPVVVRFARDRRGDAQAIARLPVATPDGGQVALGEVAEVRFSTGPDMVRSEDGQLVGFVFVDPGERAPSEWVADARAAMADLTLPPGTRVEWAGQYRAYERAMEQLAFVVPLTLLLVAVLLHLNTGSWAETALVAFAVPFSLVGAVWLLWALDYHLSVAVWVGMIALAGLDAETGVVMLLYLKLAHARAAPKTWAELVEAIVDGAARRLRPKLMTVATAFFGLVPLLWSEGTGADLMRRIAAPMVGGLGTSFLLELLVYPALFAVWKGRGLPRG